MQTQYKARGHQGPIFSTNLKQLPLSKQHFSFLISLILVGLTSSSAFATTYTFTNASGDQDWATVANWSPSYPGTTIGAGDAVIVNERCDIFINLTNNGTFTNSNLLSNFGAFVNNGDLINNFYFGNNSNLTNSSTGSIINYHQLVNSGTLTNTAGGTITTDRELRNNSAGTINNAGTIENSQTATNHGIFNNTGTIDVVSSGFWNYGTLNHSGHILIGGNSQLILASGGNFVLQMNHNSLPANISWESSSTITIDPGSTVALAENLTLEANNTFVVNGTLTVNASATLTNSGTVEVNGNLTLNTGSTLANNDTGTLTIHTGGFLNNYGTVNNTFGILTNYWVFSNYSNGIVNNSGTLNNNPSGTIGNNSGGNLNNYSTLTNNGNLINNSASTLTNFSTLTNNNVLTNNSGGFLNNYGTLTNTSGTLTNNGGFSNYSGGVVNNSGTLDNNSGSTLTNIGTLTNNGILNNLNGSILTIDVGGALNINTNATLTNHLGGTLNITGVLNMGYLGTLTNFGIMTLSMNGSLYSNLGGILYNNNNLTLNDNSTLTNNGTLTNNSTVYNNGILINNSGGIMNGSGTIVQNDTYVGASGGAIAPGNSPGTLTVIGNINIGGNTYECEIDVAVPNNDVLAVTGQATLTDATLEVNWLSPPTVAGTYTIMTFGSRVGEFANVTIPLVPEDAFTINYTATEVTITLSSILPVELLYIRGEALDQSNKISWASATEVNAEHYLIERSIKGLDSWQEIGRVDAVGNSATTVRYEFLDKTPEAAAYYRLKTIDFDDTFEYSDIIYLERKSDGFELLSVYPIPTQNEVNVDFNLSSSRPVVLTLTDISGRILMSDTYQAESGANQWNLDLSTFNAGMYFLQIDNGREQVVRRVVKQ